MRVLSFYNTGECNEQSSGAVSFRKGRDASYSDADSVWVNAVRSVSSRRSRGEENRRSAECAVRSCKRTGAAGAGGSTAAVVRQSGI